MAKIRKPFTVLITLLITTLLLVACSAELDSEFEKITKDLVTNMAVELAENLADNLPTEDEVAGTGEKSQLTPNGRLEVHFLDVGQADSILIQSQDRFMLVDAGNNNDAEFVVEYLKDQGVTKLDYVIGTHPHEDHIGGLDVVIDSFEIGKVIMPQVTHTTKTFEDVIRAIKNKGLKITAPTPGSILELGEAKAEVLAPNSTSYDNLNDYSIVLRLEHGANSFLFTGDAEEVSEEEILEKGYKIASDVLKVGHHGSRTSTTTAFLNRVNPTYAVISVGKDNDYGHPHKEILQRLEEKDVKILRTDEAGTVICVSDGKTISFEYASAN